MGLLLIWVERNRALKWLPVWIVVVIGAWVIFFPDEILFSDSFMVIESSELSEASGMVITDRGEHYIVNDSGNPETVYQIDAKGKTLRSIEIAGVSNRDWEALCQTDSTLLVADIGDNQQNRTRVSVYAILLDSLRQSNRPEATRYRFQYPEHPHNAEAFFIDPMTGDWFVISKNGLQGILYRVAYPQSTKIVMSAVLEDVVVPGVFISSADISRDGLRIIVKSIFGVRIWNRNLDEDVVSVFKREPNDSYLILNPFSEAVAFNSSELGFALISEGFFWVSTVAKIRHYHIP